MDVAVWFVAAMLRLNPDSLFVPFDSQAYDAKVDPNDSILSLSEWLSKFGGGETDCSIPLAVVNKQYDIVKLWA